MSDDETPETPEERMERVRGVNNELRRRRQERGAENIPDRRPQPSRTLDELDMVAYTAKITYNGRGDVVWTIVIPHQYREMAEGLPATYGTPLHITAQKWRPLGAVQSGE